ncbi:hypothetical protein LTR91_008072 [Friedmanniomyces endolithicus]|uniref:Uncharacterized protein n=1 Tax=Friedmanniomyces endolithicus TaxID=329885 RepID=A0A4U0UPY8_9PEZI|nr:hypothetical protein LTS09_003389 [Friedmanniomyces endolithicus]KAK0289014.1 hypothetical protein LTR35_003416 [Friedmanniomyces endolithicus]KAK0293211.1 hypothetical protein LTS00_007814 [Friedmanniomyces endolithicus]KAK0304873.1 hypothetical protein LTR01_007077 [Friedmanniomyces endolithicus]KAK0319545.1 hypothetical protein LTR82_009612 [Friedmanniomyces endolithicus]
MAKPNPSNSGNGPDTNVATPELTAITSSSATTPPIDHDIAMTDDDMTAGPLLTDENVIGANDDDVAYSIARYAMDVNAVGRRKHQRTFLWTTSDSRISYSVDKHGPTKGHDSAARLPSQEEQTSDGDDMKEYLEVGVVLGLDPAKYHPSGQISGWNKAREAARVAAGTLQRGDTEMRVFTPVIDHIKPGVGLKYYVGCVREKGRLHPRTVNQPSVFFYAEFWEGSTLLQSLNVRKSILSNNIREHAARNQEQAEQTTTARHPSAGTIRLEAADPLIATTSNNLVAHLRSTFNLYNQTQSAEHLKHVKELLDMASPDLQLGSDTHDVGVVAFYDYDKPFEQSNAVAVIAELKSAHPNMADISSQLVTKVRNTIATNEELRAELPYSGLGYFLTMCDIYFSMESGDDQTSVIVKEVLHFVSIHNMFIPGWPIPQAVLQSAGSTVL